MSRFKQILDTSDNPELEALYHDMVQSGFGTTVLINWLTSQSTCRNSRWIVPAKRMCVLLKAENDRCLVAGRIEHGQILPRCECRYAVGRDVIGSSIRSQGIRWFSSPDHDRARHADRRCRSGTCA